VSLSGDPLPEAKAAWDILRALDLRTRGVQLIACPTCGRTCIPVEQIARRVEAELSDVTVPLKVAVMGCIVNGLGEGREADVGIAGGKDGGALFVKGQEPRKVTGDLAEILIGEVRRIIQNSEFRIKN
jgi:(E)-4-hydroxy-3-methylbut-2-enyl-diphosphate synthase